LWNGSDLTGKTILLHNEQGMGDTMQFVRYAPMVAERGAKIILECQKELISLMRDVKGLSQVVVQGDPLPQFDVHCPLLSLPLVFGTNIGNIPAKVPYIRADSLLVKKWGERIRSDKPIIKVGLVWAGRPGHRKDRYRSLALAEFAPLIGIRGATFYSLQKGTGAVQAKTPPEGMELIDYMDEVGDFSDTAALIENLDLVVSVDTSVAHLAGAMGKPVWTLHAFPPDWRWLLDREDSPWYPTMKLFRQQSPGDWNSVIAALARELRSLIEEQSSGDSVKELDISNKELQQQNRIEEKASRGNSLIAEEDPKKPPDFGKEGTIVMKTDETIAFILNCEGMGDCLFAIPVIKKIHLMSGPNSRFVIFTHHPNLFVKCPYVDAAFSIHDATERAKYKKVIVLFDTSKLAHWTVDTFDFISIPAGIGELSFREKQLEYFPSEEDQSKRYDVVINTSVTWPSRSWPIENWQMVADYILEQGYSVAVVGKDTFSKADNMMKKSFGLKGCTDLTNKLSLDQTYYTIRNCALFITCQNGLSVLSGATDTEIIVLDMSIEWSKRAIYRHEDPHYKVSYVKGNCMLYCCQSLTCPVFGEFRCIPAVDQTLEVVKRKLDAEKQRAISLRDSSNSNAFRLPPYGRHQSFDLVKNIIMSDEYKNPVIVEIGMTRAIGNWFGDGYSTPFLAYLVNKKEGQLYSNDVEPEAKSKCEHILKEYGLYTDRVHLIIEDALSFLNRWGKDFGRTIDLLYLDAWDYGEGDAARISEENHLKAFKQIESHLSDKALILIDDIHDTVTFKGKGRLVIPYLRGKGYQTLYLGYQCLFSKKV